MKNKLKFRVSNRFVIIFLSSLIISIIINIKLYNAKVKESLINTSLETFDTHRTISNELYNILNNVEADFNFFEENLIDILQQDRSHKITQEKIKVIISFLQSHKKYFKLRLINQKGIEIFKIKKNSNSHFFLANDFHNLSTQPYYQDLAKVGHDEFYFSAMEPNIINGIIEEPLRTTVRVSKKIKISDKDHLIILNIDGNEIHQLFSKAAKNDDISSSRLLINKEGSFITYWPKLDFKSFFIPKSNFATQSPEVFNLLKQNPAQQGHFDHNDHHYVYSALDLPSTSERWFLISLVSSTYWKKKIKSSLIGWIFWELLFLSLFLTWLYQDEKKHFEDKIKNVLLNERTEFIQNVSHQLKTPIAIILNLVESNGKNLFNYKEIKSEINGLVKIIDDMLTLAQVDAVKKIELHHENIIELINTAIERMFSLAKEKNVSIHFNIENESAYDIEQYEVAVMGDLFISALINIIENAIQFSPANEQVLISLKKETHRYIICIKDAGPGISASFKPLLFTRFNRADKSKKGTGLGLAIAKKIIELHFGSIRLLETQKGAAFEIII